MTPRPWPRPRVWIVAAAYLGVTIVTSWPLVTRLTTSLAGDYGDSAFIAWVMGWVDQHLTALLHGDTGAWAAMWHAPIFAPEASTLTYSEHFVGPAAQALPIYWLTHNPLLAYNVLHMAAFVLTALAVHLLAYRFTGSHVAGAVAGLTLAFSQYRLTWSLAHLQTLSVQWWIFALLAIDVFAETGALWALAGATGGIVALSLSSTYLMAYSALFTPFFAVWALARHSRLRDLRRWLGLAGAGAAALLCVWPFVRPYLIMREALGVTRSLGEVAGNSATLAGYWGEMPWLGPLLVMAAVGVAVRPRPGASGLSRGASWGLLAMAVAALTLALGPVISIGATTLPGPYGVLFHVPGFQGLRVAHRFAAIGLVFVSVLAGLGAASLFRHRMGVAAVVVLTALATRTAWTVPYPIDVPIASRDLAAAPEYLRPAAATPPIYRFARTLPATAVLVELPFGDIGYEIRYTFFTLAHGHRTLNGYSGVLPKSYLTRQPVLRAPLADLDASWRALDPATHVVVHTGAWRDDTGQRLRTWLDAHDARLVASVDGAWLYELPPR